ncbi:predicted protein [Chaetoceros tenuissimus]|uniref:MYND-type domain-containing protein n=1 Tax=Chaetoceros tenuissimus TaxID=426638 RepID=A0AAD3D582_9STRA|nr:predicted protein [Chaetoceros tenuissimus]
MGKKGKRSRQKTVTAADRASIQDVQTKIEELSKKFRKSNCLNLFSQAANELREGIQLIETIMLDSSDTLLKMNLHTWFVQSKVILYSNLMTLELDRYNFSATIEIYIALFERGNMKMNMKILSRIFHSLTVQYEEALLRQGKGSVDALIALSNSLVSHGRKVYDTLEIDLLRTADILRIKKYFDSAIVFGKQLEELTGDRLSIATTYLEQYTVGNKSLPEDFLLNMAHVLQKHRNDGFNTANAGSVLVLAQSTYLFHKLHDDTEEMVRKAVGFIEEYLDMVSKVQSYCFTCTQTATESEVQFVCSGCRVACYCSIDHQRLTWKKEAVRGMRIGHDILCPVMKGYRKWRHAKDNCDNERLSRLRRRFERECLNLLSDGLGLKDKCFQK